MATLRLEWADLDVEPCDGVVDGPTWDDVRSIVEHYGRCTEGFIILARADEDFVQTTWKDGDPDEGLTVEWRRPSGEHCELDEEFIAPERAVAVFGQFFHHPEAMASTGRWKAMEL